VDTGLLVSGDWEAVVGAGAVLGAEPPSSSAPERARTPTTAPTETAPAMKDEMRLIATI
jgi:hypothetical protein